MAVVVVGYPVLYPYTYPPESSVTASSAAYPSERSNVTVFGGERVPADASGGLNFEVSPGVAEVYVDGLYVGTSQDFSSEGGPLAIIPGSHRIELRAPGYRTIALDVIIPAGQVVPYRGALEPVRPY